MKEGRLVMDDDSGYRKYECPECKHTQWVLPEWKKTMTCKGCGRRYNLPQSDEKGGEE